MASLGKVTQYLRSLIAKQVDEHGIVVWYDPEKAYAEAVKALQLPNTEILCYQDSFFRLRWEIDQKQLLDGEEPPRLVVYVPMTQEQCHRALIELEAAGVVVQPGQQPPTRNTRLVVVARNALRPVLGEAATAEIDNQVESGKLTLADLDELAAKGGEVSKGVLTLIFRTGNPQEIALAFLGSAHYDDEMDKKDAGGELRTILAKEFDFVATQELALQEVRQRLARHILMTELAVGLGEALPARLARVAVASTPTAREACAILAKTWRIRRDMRESYLAAARAVEKELSLAASDFDPKTLENLETFPILEQALLQCAERRLLESTDGDVLRLAESRMKRFWCEAEPQFQARWGLLASTARLLLEAERVAQALKKAPASLAGLIKEYAQSPQPWCLLDTYHRNVESQWHNFEPHGSDDDYLEKLIHRARQRYAAVGAELARIFAGQLHSGFPPKGILHQRQTFEKYVKPTLGQEKIAYVWVDALRFEMGRELGRILADEFEMELQPAFAALPTITEIGMAALLPRAHETAKVIKSASGRLALEIAGRIIKDRKDRVAFLRECAGVAVCDVKLDDLLPKPAKTVREKLQTAQLILVTSQEIDDLCEQDNIVQARRQLDSVLHDVRRGIRLLVELGVARIIVTSDHGHLFAEELSEDMKVEAPGGETVELRRRVWVGHGGQALDATLRLPLRALGMDGEFDLVTPLTFAGFKCKGGPRAYFHGGISPQEVIVPILVLKPLLKPVRRTPAPISWDLIPGSPKLTTRFFSVQVTGTIDDLFDVEPPKVRVELRAKNKVISRAVSASYGFEESTCDVALKKDENNPKKIAPNTITLMVVEEPAQKTVGLYLLDAVTQVELARCDKIAVALSM